ncbi:MAG: hypothetical protein UX37_C0001G0007 [Microgenomates group bacterium GW2011_GWA2_46_16]|nr:MAG: hypothetical protein UX37_C0001G0007 [Microgenomates group bacterium GW2011_GWA2_46_16]
MPDRAGTGNARGNITHRGVVVVTNPSGNEASGSITNRPVVAQIIGGAGFDGDSFTGNVENRARTKSASAGVIIGEDVRDEKGSFTRQNLVAGTNRVGGHKFLQNFTTKIFNFENGFKRNLDALIGKDAKGGGHVEHGHFTTTQGKGKTIILRISPRSDTQLGSKSQKISHTI